MRDRQAMAASPGVTAGTFSSMTPEEFRLLGHEVIDWIADYRESLPARHVQATARPGEVRRQIPTVAPLCRSRWPRSCRISTVSSCQVCALTTERSDVATTWTVIRNAAERPWHAESLSA